MRETASFIKRRSFAIRSDGIAMAVSYLVSCSMRLPMVRRIAPTHGPLTNVRAYPSQSHWPAVRPLSCVRRVRSRSPFWDLAGKRPSEWDWNGPPRCVAGHVDQLRLAGSAA